METGAIFIFALITLLAILIIFLLIYSFSKKKKTDFLSTRLEETSNELNAITGELAIKEKEFNNIGIRADKLDNEVSVLRENVTNLKSERSALQSRLEEKEKSLQEIKHQLQDSKNEIYELNQRAINDQRSISELKTTVDKERESSKEKLQLLNEARERLSQEFQNLGSKIFEDNTRKFTEQNKTNIENMLNPLREQIKDFDKKVSDVYDKESKERITLLKQIEYLRDLNQQISQDAVNLTNALKGETKTQGTWGEIILEKVLEMSGLRKGIEYSAQVSFSSAEGKTVRPDVIVYLPEGKKVVIDSKVSLIAYERYSSANDQEQKNSALKEHLVSVNNHIRDLGNKSYEDISEIQSLNYVLLFIPVESAFMLAVQSDIEIFRKAFDKNIIIVCPSTLLATLRTIQSIWQFEYQSQNAQSIADRAGKLHDRFVEFISHIENIGVRLEQATSAHEDAMKALSTGRGNLIGQVEKLEKLGVKNRKSLPENLRNSEPDEEAEDKDPGGDDERNVPFKTHHN